MSIEVNEKNARGLNLKIIAQDKEIEELKETIVSMNNAMRGLGGRVQALEANLAVVVAGGYSSGPTVR